ARPFACWDNQPVICNEIPSYPSYRRKAGLKGDPPPIRPISNLTKESKVITDDDVRELMLSDDGEFIQQRDMDRSLVRIRVPAPCPIPVSIKEETDGALVLVTHLRNKF